MHFRNIGRIVTEKATTKRVPDLPYAVMECGFAAVLTSNKRKTSRFNTKIYGHK